MGRVTKEVLRARTRAFALRVIRVVDALPHTRIGDVIERQLLRTGTSVGANYRSACRARSRREFVAKMGLIEEEADEALFWLELLVDVRVMPGERLTPLMKEAEELVAIAAASVRTARRSRS